MTTPSGHLDPTPRCPACDYSLEGLDDRRCPECGVLVAAPSRRRRPPRRFFVVFWALIGGAVLSWVGLVAVQAAVGAGVRGLSGLRLALLASGLVATPLVIAALLAVLLRRRMAWRVASVVSAPLAFVLVLLALPSVLFWFDVLADMRDPPGGLWHWSAIPPVWCGAFGLAVMVELFAQHARVVRSTGATVPAEGMAPGVPE